VECGRCRFEQRGPQHEILGRVADEHELGEHDEVGALGGRLIACPPDEVRVPSDVADRRIQLRAGDRQGH